MKQKLITIKKNFRKQIPNFQFLISNFQFPISNFKFPISNFKFPISNFKFPISNFKFPISNFKFPNSNNGFTLIELIVSIAIMTMLISITLTNYRGGGKGTDLIMTTQKMVTDFRLAQNNTLGSVEYNNSIPQGGWGIYVSTENKTSYIVFADVNGNGEYDAGVEDNNSFGARTIILPNKMIIDAINTEKDGNSNNVHIVFLPPDPVTNIYNKTTMNTSTDATITIKEEWNNTTKDILINSFGLIEVEN